mgnify:CR=1 FL=1
MIQRFRFGLPLPTDSVVQEIPVSAGPVPFLTAEEDGWAYRMAPDAIVYGLGEMPRGINKRGWHYVTNNTDEARHSEDKLSYYGAHNFLLIDGGAGRECFGVFIDFPGKVRYDIGYTEYDALRFATEEPDHELYIITGDDLNAISRQFRQLIGRSYIPPKWAFGLAQSRFGYKTAEDVREVARQYKENDLPLDMICMDIDYMQDYADFTVNKQRFPDLAALSAELKAQGIRLVPIIDAGVRIDPENPVCAEGLANGYFCTKADGTPFIAAVWPGKAYFADFLRPEVREWFGHKYKALTDCGIEGFWNDMNEPAIFYSREGLAERLDHPPVPHEDGTIDHFGQAIGWLNLSNAPEDYARFYHKVDGKMVRHDQVHNLYGYNMTRAASEGLASIAPGKRFLLFSRSSCIGMHRYGGVWTGDNHSWWSHLLLNLKMLPSLNMCGFLYVGADLGGFNADTSRDLLLRWLALGVFTPLMRNHSGSDTRRQEFYQFEGPEDFRSVIETRYRLIPYLYSEYMKAALNGDMLFKPLAFVYPEDEIALQTEDQLMLGNEVMIAPVYTQNATGRMVYLPEEMLFVKFGPEGRITQEVLPAGTHFVKVALNEVPLFIRKGACIPVADPAQTVAGIDPATIRMIGWPGASYDRYDDDGVTIPAEE